MGRLICLLHVYTDIVFAVSMISYFMQSSGHEHFQTAHRILMYLLKFVQILIGQVAFLIDNQHQYDVLLLKEISSLGRVRNIL